MYSRNTGEPDHDKQHQQLAGCSMIGKLSGKMFYSKTFFYLKSIKAA